MPTPPIDAKYKVKRKGKKDFRSMVTDIIAFQHKIFRLTAGMSDEIQYPDFKYLLSLERVATYKKKAISAMVLSHCSSYTFHACLRALRRMEPRGIVVRVTDSHWDVTVYGANLIKRYNRTFHQFLSGKIKLPDG